MRVQWNTRDAGFQPQVRWGPQTVRYDGSSSDAGAGPMYPSSAPAASSRYGAEDMCGGGAVTVSSAVAAGAWSRAVA